MPPQLEERTHLRDTYRVMSELVRYHQTGVGHGWVEVDGRRTTLDAETWVSTRDHSWGVRYDVGPPAPDRPPTSIPAGVGFMMVYLARENRVQVVDFGPGEREHKRRLRTRQEATYRLTYMPAASWRSQAVRLTRWAKEHLPGRAVAAS